MNVTLIFSIIGACGTIFSVFYGMHNISKSNEKIATSQEIFNSEMNQDIKYIRANQQTLTKKIEEIGSEQNKTQGQVLVLEEKVKSTNSRIDNLEKDLKRKIS